MYILYETRMKETNYFDFWKRVLSIQIIRLRVEDYYLEFYGGRHSKPHAYVEKHSWQSISTDFVVNFFWLIQWKKRERRRSRKVYQLFTDNEWLIVLHFFFVTSREKSIVLLQKWYSCRTSLFFLVHVFLGLIIRLYWTCAIHKHNFFNWVYRLMDLNNLKPILFSGPIIFFKNKLR